MQCRCRWSHSIRMTKCGPLHVRLQRLAPLNPHRFASVPRGDVLAILRLSPPQIHGDARHDFQGVPGCISEARACRWYLILFMLRSTAKVMSKHRTCSDSRLSKYLHTFHASCLTMKSAQADRIVSTTTYLVCSMQL